MQYIWDYGETKLMELVTTTVLWNYTHGHQLNYKDGWTEAANFTSVVGCEELSWLSGPNVFQQVQLWFLMTTFPCKFWTKISCRNNARMFWHSCHFLLLKYVESWQDCSLLCLFFYSFLFPISIPSHSLLSIQSPSKTGGDTFLILSTAQRNAQHSEISTFFFFLDKLVFATASQGRALSAPPPNNVLQRARGEWTRAKSVKSANSGAYFH